MTAFAIYPAEFSLPRQGGENFRWRLSGFMRGNDRFNRVDADHDAASIKPVLHVGGSGYPFKILVSVVSLVLVLVMNKRKVEWVRNEGRRDKAVDGHRFYFSRLRKFNLGVSCGFRADKDALSSVPTFRSPHVSGEASHASFVADLIKSFVSSNGSPFLSRVGLRAGRCLNLHIGEKVSDQRLDVEHLRFSPAIRMKPDVDAQVAIRSKDTEHPTIKRARGLPPTMFGYASQSSHSKVVRDFVDAFVVGDREPSFVCQGHQAGLLLSRNTNLDQTTASPSKPQGTALRNEIEEK